MDATTAWVTCVGMLCFALMVTSVSNMIIDYLKVRK